MTRTPGIGCPAATRHTESSGRPIVRQKDPTVIRSPRQARPSASIRPKSARARTRWASQLERISLALMPFHAFPNFFGLPLALG